MKIVFTDSKTIVAGKADLRVFEQFGEVILYESTTPEQIAERIKDADMALCNKTIFSAEVMSNAPKLKYIGLFATGYNNVDVDYAAKHGITVCNAGSYSTDAVAQHTFALMLNHFSRVSEYNNFVKDGGWKNSEVFSPMVYETHELSGKTLGIVGYGRIGKAVAKIANAFGMRVIVSTRTPQTDSSVEFVTFDELLAQSDVVTVHCPLNNLSDKMFNHDSFSKFKRGAYFINTSRGGVVDEPALKDALESGILCGAAVDTISVEPMSGDCRLFGVKNLTITPHIAWAPVETVERLIGIAADNIKCYLEGKPKNKVN